MTDPTEPAEASGRIGLEGELFWPQYLPGDRRRPLAMRAFLEVTGLSSTHGGGQATTPGTAQLVLRVSCLPDLHRARHQASGSQLGVPMLAEVWETSSGLLFLASVPGRWRGLQLSDQTEENTGPPAAGERGHDGLTKGDDPVPVTIVRVLLETPDRPRLIPVKCRDHPEMSVDTAAVHRKAIQAQQAQSSRRPVVSVAAVGPAVQ